MPVSSTLPGALPHRAATSQPFRNLLNVGRAGAAAAADECRAGIMPALAQVAKFGGDGLAQPDFVNCVVLFAGIGINDDGFGGRGAYFADEAGNVAGRGAVDADGDDLLDGV